MQEITSLQNPRIAALRALHHKKYRDAENAFLVEGEKMVSEALQHAKVRTLVIGQDCVEDGRFDGLVRDAQEREILMLSVPNRLIETLSGSKTPQGILAQVEMPPEGAPNTGLLLALDAVQDPGNVGTMIRTADAAGWQGVLLGKGCADAFGAKCVQASMGSIFRVPMLRDVDLPVFLSGLKSAGWSIASGVLNGEDIYSASLPKQNAVLVIGNESAGVTPALAELATHGLKLPMRGGAESLNAAVAAGIMMYEWTREGRE